ncbi:cytochrome P450 [Streptomyces violaceusniger]
MRVDSNPLSVEAAAGKMLIVTDPPAHTRLRRVMHSAFLPRVIGQLEQNMRGVVDSLIDDVAGQATVEFVGQVAAQLPVAIISEIMNIPMADRDLMVNLTSRAFGASVGLREGDSDDADRAQAHSEIFLYYAELIEKRRRDLGQDVVSALIRAEPDGGPLTDEEILLNCDGLLTGANETTRHATAAGLLGLIRQPEQWARLRAGAVPIEMAVEEILRFTSPALHVMRVATKDVTIGGQLIRAGDSVAVWLASANRDDAEFENPDQLDLGRTPNRHLTFGIGRHFCLGSTLARVELKVLLQALADRVAEPVLVGPVRRTRSNFMWGIDELPVRLT